MFRTFKFSVVAAAATALMASTALARALGGGSPTAPGAVDLLHTAASAGTVKVSYLRLMPETLAKRIAADDLRNRPALIGDDPVTEVQAVFEARDEMYRALADDTIQLDEASIEAAVEQTASACR